MKHLCTILATVFAAAFTASAKTFDWPIDSPAAKAAQFAAYHGETVRFNLRLGGAMTNLSPVAIYYQTNGMGKAEWFGPVPGTIFDPTNDCGAAAYRFFILCNDPDGKDYTANGSLRMLDSPGFEPSAVPLPVQSLDFAAIEVLNPPWPDAATVTNIVLDVAPAPGNYAAVSNAAMNAAQAATNLVADATNGIPRVAESESNPGYAANAVYALNADYAQRADGLHGAEDRTSDTIFTQLDAATETNEQQTAAIAAIGPAATNYTDSAIAAATNAIPTRDDLEKGWWSDWSCNPATLNGVPITIGPGVGDNEYAPMVGDVIIGNPMRAIGPDGSLRWQDNEWNGEGELVATRHRVAAPVPTKPEDIGAASNNALAAVRALADAATETNAQQTAALASQASQLSQQSQSLSTIGSQVNSIGAHLNAEDAHFVSTNYDSVVHVPEAYVEIKMSNSWITIWREMTRWDRFVGSAFDWTAWNGFHAFQTHVTTELAFKADRAWGVYDSETGGYSPEGYTQISSSNILIAAGMAYQRTVTSAGSVWVLQCNSGAATIGGDTNGFFRVIDGDGNTQFEIVKGDRREMGADASGITVSAGNVMTIPYSVESAEHPTISCCNNIATANWKDETDADCLCSVSWSGTSGAWVATVTPKTAQPSMFVKATFMAGGETYIRNLAPVSMDAIVIRGVKYYLGTAVISGHTVLTLSTTPPSP